MAKNLEKKKKNETKKDKKIIKNLEKKIEHEINLKIQNLKIEIKKMGKKAKNEAIENPEKNLKIKTDNLEKKIHEFQRSKKKH